MAEMYCRFRIKTRHIFYLDLDSAVIKWTMLSNNIYVWEWVNLGQFDYLS